MVWDLNHNLTTSIMRIAVLLLIYTCFVTSVTVAQQAVDQQINSQYENKIHQAFIYQVSPQSKMADDWVIKSYQANRQEERASFINELSTDTSWSYTETKGYTDSLIAPSAFTQYIIDGDTTDYRRLSNQYEWNPETTNWNISREQTSFVTSGHTDSTRTYYYQNGESEPYHGIKYIYPNPPADGASYESMNEVFVPGTGWTKDIRQLSYRDENGQDTLSKTFAFNTDLREYQLSRLQRYREGNEYILEIDEQWMNGERYSRQRSYIKQYEDGRYMYQVSTTYHEEQQNYTDGDSLHFIYADNAAKVEATGYQWMDSSWVLTQAYTSYRHETGDGAYLTDSTLVYSIEIDEQTQERSVGDLQIKNVLIYDEHGNPIETWNYSLIDDSLQLNSKTLRYYREVNDSFQQYRQQTYTLDVASGTLFLSFETESKFNSDGLNIGYKSFRFDASGDTTSGYVNEYEYKDNGTRIYTRFDWDATISELILASYRIYGRSYVDQPYTQDVTIAQYNGETNISRSMNGSNGYPGVFNDGPIYIEPGDTVRLHVSAMNPDMTIPEVEVSNMPASATFDPESREFFWIVDEATPMPMTYTATRGDKSVSTEVEFITDPISLDAETGTVPQQFSLSQNYPNPFNPSTTIAFSLPAASHVRLTVYNMLGQQVAVLVASRKSAGEHTLSFDASALPSGMYIYRMQAQNYSESRKMVLIK